MNLQRAGVDPCPVLLTYRRRLHFDVDESWFRHDEQDVRSPALGFTAATNMMIAVNTAALEYMLAVMVAIGIAKAHYVNELDKKSKGIRSKWQSRYNGDEIDCSSYT